MLAGTKLLRGEDQKIYTYMGPTCIKNTIEDEINVLDPDNLLILTPENQIAVVSKNFVISNFTRYLPDEMQVVKKLLTEADFNPDVP